MTERKGVLKIVAIILLSAVAVFCAVMAYGGENIIFSSADANEETTNLPDGFYRDGENWHYYENGAVSDRSGKIEGTVDGKNGVWVTVNGKVDFTVTSLESIGEGRWQYIKDGAVSEKTSAEASLIFGEYLNMPDSSEEIVAFGNFSLSEEKKGLLQSEIDKVKGKGYEVGIVVMNLNSLEGFSFNADEKIYSASAIKGPYITALADSDNSVLESERVRIEAVLKRSSNYDYESLREKYGSELFTAFSARTGNDLVVDTTRNYQYLTPRRLAHLWAESYIFFENSAVGEKLGEMFENPEISPINKVCAEKYKTRTKAGWITKNNIKVTNDAGIVYTEKGDYLVVIMTTAPCDFRVVENLASSVVSVIE